MNLLSHQVQVHAMPLSICFLSNGCIVLIRTAGRMVYSIPNQGLGFFLLNECLSVWKDGEEPEEFEYNVMYDYKNHPLLLQWLQELNLRNPVTGQFRKETE